MKVLVLNSGSSSIKYQVFQMVDEMPLASGLVERIGEPSGALRQSWTGPQGRPQTIDEQARFPDHAQSMSRIVVALAEAGIVGSAKELFAIGHRVVHGGEAFREPTRIDERVLATIRQLIPLAPLHNPANLVGIEVALRECPGIPQVAVFDTAFHQSLPPRAFRYALPQELYETLRVRRYGFHGTSHAYVAGVAAQYLSRPLASLRLIVLHLGNGASAAAIAGGRSIDTSMGMTPLEGLVMGTRSGDLDPAVVLYLARQTGQSLEELDRLLNRQSGLRGLCGAGDMRTVLERAERGDERARLALDVYVYRIRKYVGAYHAVLGGLDALVFTAGVGENAPEVRRRVCSGLEHLGLTLDPARNRAAGGGGVHQIQAPPASVRILVVPTDEELSIARQTVRCLSTSAGPGD